jgi:hypothetical protein
MNNLLAEVASNVALELCNRVNRGRKWLFHTTQLAILSLSHFDFPFALRPADDLRTRDLPSGVEGKDMPFAVAATVSKLRPRPIPECLNVYFGAVLRNDRFWSRPDDCIEV